MCEPEVTTGGDHLGGDDGYHAEEQHAPVATGSEVLHVHLA